MLSSFVGTTVRLTPREGAPFFGTILSVDPKTATLSLRRADTSDVVSVRREDLIDVSTVTLQTPSPATRPELSDKKKRNRKKSERTGSPAPGAVSKSALETVPAPASSASRPSVRSSTPTDAPTSAVDEEFDFVKSAQNFDKKKIWDEIRNQESSSNAQLLVDINRNPALHQTASSTPSQTRQPMLAADESVLDDALNEKEARLAKNDTLRNALDMARDEVERLRTQLALSEALSGVHLEPLDDGAYQVSIFRDGWTSAAHWRRKHTGGDSVGPEGALRYYLNAPGIKDTENVSLGYEGPDRMASDPNVLDALPEHFQAGNIKVKLDNAPMFHQRLYDVLRGA